MGAATWLARGALSVPIELTNFLFRVIVVFDFFVLPKRMEDKTSMLPLIMY